MRWLVVALILLATPAFAQTGPGSLHSSGAAFTPVSVAGTFQELSGTTTTNAPLTMGMFFAAGQLDGSHHVQVVDNDTSTAMLCDENNRASDLAPAVRFAGLDCIDPSITGSENKSITISVVSGAPATGTDCAISDITAASASGPANLNAGISLTNIRGTAGTWTASPLTALSSGNSGWVNSTTATVLGKFKGGGGIVTGYILYMPLTNSGTPDAQMHVIYDIECYKAARAAVGGGNPIVSIRTDILLENAFVQQTSPVDDYYGVSIGVSGAVANYPNSTPAATLTLASSASNCGFGSDGVTASASLFTANSPGSLITNGTGVGVITPPDFGSGASITPTTACIRNYTNFSGSTVTGGTYTVYGWNHPWGSAISQRAWWTPSGAVPNVFAIIGSPATSSTNGPGAWLSLTGAFLNYNVTQWGPTAFSNSATTFAGTNPTGYGNGIFGDYNLQLGQTGENCAIGPIPCQDQDVTFFWDTNALGVLRRDESNALNYPIHFRDSSTGLAVNPGTATTYAAAFGQSGFCGSVTCTVIPVPTGSINPWFNDLFAHDPEPFYTSYLLTGDFKDLDAQVMWMAGAMLQNDPGFAGTGLNRIPSIAIQQRGYAWFDRTLGDTCLLLPNTNSPVLGWTKSQCETYQENQLTSTAAGNACASTTGGNPNSPPDGLLASFINCTSTYPASNGTSWLANNNMAASNFQLGYWASVAYRQLSSGMLSANGLLKLNWIQRTFTGYTQESGLDTAMLAQTEYIPFIDNSSACPGTYTGDLASMYKITALGAFGSQGFGIGVNSSNAAMRFPNQVSLTLNTTSGTAINATLSGPDPRTGTNYFATPTFYDTAGHMGWVFTSDGGIAQIVAGSISGNSFQLNTSATTTVAQGSNTASQDCSHVVTGHAFGSTTYAGYVPNVSNGGYNIPWAAPGDPHGTELDAYSISFPTSGNPNDYLELSQMADILGCDRQGAGSPECLGKATLLAITGGTQSYFINKWLVQ